MTTHLLSKDNKEMTECCDTDTIHLPLIDRVTLDPKKVDCGMKSRG